MLQLFHSPDSRSSRFIWLLEELGVEYDLVYTSIKRLNGSGAPDPRNPHPDKSVPALLHDGALITESSAIALYLTDRFAGAGLGMPIGDGRRGPYLSWLAYSAGEMEQVYEMLVRDWLDKDPRGKFVRDRDRIFKRVENALDAGPFLLGESFTAADILVSAVLGWLRELGQASPPVDLWLDRLAARPAFVRAAALDAPSPAGAN